MIYVLDLDFVVWLCAVSLDGSIVPESHWCLYHAFLWTDI